MVDDVVLVADDYDIMMELAVQMHNAAHSVMVAESAQPLARARELAAQRPKAMLVMLEGPENAVDVRGLLSSAPGTRFVFIVPEMPARAPLARVVKQYGGAILSRGDAPIVVVATLVALLAEAPADGRPGDAP